MSVATLADKTVSVERATITRDGQGGRVETWAEVLSVSARIQPLSAGESIRYSREAEIVTHKIYVPLSPDIRHGDRIVFVNVHDVTETYEVKGVRNIDHQDRFLTIEAERTQ